MITAIITFLKYALALFVIAFVYAWIITYHEYRIDYEDEVTDKSFIKWLGWYI